MSTAERIADPYNPAVRELFGATAHAGSLSGAVTVTKEEQGIALKLAATVANGQISAVRFEIRGCPHSIAVCEALARQIEGGSLAELEGFSVVELMKSLAVPAAKSGRIIAIEDTVRELGAALRADATSDEQD